MHVCVSLCVSSLSVACVHHDVHESDRQRDTERREREREFVSTKKKQLQKVEEVYTADFAELQELLYLERHRASTTSVCECVCTQELFSPCASTFVCVCKSARVCVKINKCAQLMASCYLAVRPEEVILWYTDNFGQYTGL